jgi:phage I-like protein
VATPATISDRTAFLWATYLSRYDLRDVQDGAESWIQCGKVGKFVSKVYGPFEITKADLASMVKNFNNVTPKAPTELAVDYDHLSMRPKAPGDGIAAGWFKRLDLRKNGTELWALVSWTPKAADHIRNKEYRFISPSFQKNHEDKDSGKNIGTTLLAAAVTNHPFLEGMDAITLSDDMQLAMSLGENPFAKKKTDDEEDPNAQDAAAKPGAAQKPAPGANAAKPGAEGDPNAAPKTSDDPNNPNQQGSADWELIEQALDAEAGAAGGSPDSRFVIDITGTIVTYKDGDKTFRRTFTIDGGAATLVGQPEAVTVHIVPVANPTMAGQPQQQAAAPVGAKPMPGQPQAGPIKQLSVDFTYNDRRERVEAALRASMGMPTNCLGPSSVWVRDLDDDFVFYSYDSKAYRRPYTMAEDGTVSFSAPGSEVVLQYVPVAEPQVTDGGMAMSQTFNLTDAEGKPVTLNLSDESVEQFRKALIPEGQVVVSKATIDELNGKIVNLSERIDAKDKDTVTFKLNTELDKLSQAGRITKPQRDWAAKTFAADLAAFEEWKGTLPTNLIQLNRSFGSGGDAPEATVTGQGKAAADKIAARAKEIVAAERIDLRDAMSRAALELVDESETYLDSHRPQQVQ